MGAFDSIVVRAASAALLVLSTGCQGEGSDIGPKLDRLPDASGKVLVLDDAGRGVSGARVSIEGFVARTGRSGRGDLFGNPRGRLLVRAEGRAAASRSGGRPASLAFMADIDRPDVPFAIHLPDPAGGAAVTVAAGTPLGATTLDDTTGIAATGARLQIGAGTVVQDGASPQVTLGLAQLRPEHLPGDLPAAASGAMLFSRGIFVDPPTAVFTPGATLEVVDDLLLGAGSADLYRLDAATGEWTLVGAGASSVGGFLQLSGGVSVGGLYVYAVAVPEVATVTGRVVDLEGRALSETLVGVDWLRTVTGGDGRFSITGVAGATADAAPRAAVVELHGGAIWLPTSLVTATGVLGTGAVADLGDLRLDTQLAGNIRIQLVREGAAAPLERLALSAVDGRQAGVTLTDARGQCRFDGVPTGFFGFFQGTPIDRNEIYVVEAVGFVAGGRRWSEFNAFFDDRAWVVGSRNTRALVLDDIGGGPIRDAAVVRGVIDGQGLVDFTSQGGITFVSRDFSGRATATIETVEGANKVISALSLERPDGEQLELPLRRLLRDPGGSFDRHGLVIGALSGVTPGSTRALRATRALDIGEWFDAVMLGAPIQSSVPAEIVGDTFRAGVALPLGNVTIVEDATGGASFTLDRLGLAGAIVAAEAEVTAMDLPLQYAADTQFTIVGALAGLDPALTAADLRFDLGLELPNGLVVDVARNVGGNITVVGGDVVVRLPALSGGLADSAWLVALGASSVGAAAVTQRIFARLDGSTPMVRPQLGAPVVTSPAPGATVSVDGFQVDYSLPPGVLYVVVELFSGGGEELRWTAVVPPDQFSFRFPTLPPEVSTPLVAGRTYRLTVTAYRAVDSEVAASENPYRDVTTFWRSIDAHDRGVVALAQRTLLVTVN